MRDMAGTVVSVIPSRLLDFSSLAMGSSMELVLKQSIDVTAWMAASLLVRVSTVDLSGGDIFITAYLEGLTPDDPGARRPPCRARNSRRTPQTSPEATFAEIR